jgi:hypothetical protein
MTLWHVPAAGRNREIVSLARPDHSVFSQQLELVESYVELRGERTSEILTQLEPLNAFWSSITNVHPARTPRTLELLDAANRFAIIVEMRFKHAFACPRPIEFSPQLQPMVLTPGHGSLPSGHSTQAYIVASVLLELLRGRVTRPNRRKPEQTEDPLREQLMAQAARIAINRTVAGVHFPVDSAAGRLLGTTLAGYFLARCTGTEAPRGRGSFKARRFEGKAYRGTDDFDPHEDLDRSHGHVKVLGQAQAEGSEILHWLWRRARGEWDGSALRG